MSFLANIFKKKSKSEDKRDEEPQDPEAKDRRLKKQLSISRSGRFKQKNRQRGGVADRPDLFLQHEDEKKSESRPQAGTSNSPGNSCREVNGIVIPGGVRLNEQMAS